MHARSWQEMVDAPAGDRHLVQVYRERGFLVAAVTAWLGDALRHGGGAVLICAPRNEADVLARLRADGLDPDAARREGRLVALDADECLAMFMDGPRPSETRFHALADDLFAGVRAATRPGAEVRAWGEMVDLLTKRGNSDGAQRLEAIWNEAIARGGFRLLCSYELDNLDPATHDGPLHAACAGHARLLPEADPAAFTRAVDLALVEEYGEREAAHLRASLGATRPIAISMPPAESILVTLRASQPERGARVLAAVRRILDGQAGATNA